MRRRGPVVVGRRGPGLVGTMARTAVIAGTATATSKAVSGAMSGGQQQQQAAAQQQAMAQQQAELAAQQGYIAGQQDAMAQQAAIQAPVEPAGSSFDEQLVQIQKLSALKDQGLLTDEEFAAKKAQILGI
ncbi:MAG: SHOCT domain-containing protein [Caldilineae bacterium]|nr:SHOCT domain-containing protein [Anaerolineae bacterium]MCB0203404.1 SHOCT domain-containing protein [Anaerolineae bacterium]MCB9153497.1 SHOCT domain-containing protein [Caldilineae bacterium]